MKKSDITHNDVFIYSDTEYNRKLGIVGRLAIVIDLDSYNGVMTRCGGYDGEYIYYLAKDIQLEKWIVGIDLAKGDEVNNDRNVFYQG
jgi:hypothetical protein